MKLQFKKNDLIESINIVSKAVPSKTTMSILECILLDASNGKIELMANDTEFGIETECEGNILVPGKVALEAKLFSEIIRRLPQDNDIEVTIETDERNNAVISCENSIFKIAGRDGNEFTVLPKIDRNQSISLSQFTLKNVINQTIFSIALNDSNKKMTGELFEVKEDNFTVTSLDGHRISIRRTKLNDKYPDAKAIVPGKALSEISKILTGGVYDEVVLSFSSNHIMFEFNNTVVVTRLIDGEYFHVAQMLSEDYETKIQVNRRKLLDCIERSTIFVRDNDKQPLVLKIEDNVLGLKINTDLGTMDAEVAINKTGNDLMIGFNPRFLVDALRSIEDEEVSIYMSIPRSPCFIRDDKETYTYMILPVNFNADAV
ncbi:DNA polymerase III subunit beta [Oribacterium sp. HCP28S3_H8]|uniref:DNA polymerase III subunit beta n=1 Tax=Oribacterium sp. HCP28S3_H8 TaxID=3438945 RepID=UPI003F899999